MENGKQYRFISVPVKYEIADASGKNRFLKIVFKTDAQLSRVEPQFGK